MVDEQWDKHRRTANWLDELGNIIAPFKAVLPLAAIAFLPLAGQLPYLSGDPACLVILALPCNAALAAA